MPYFETSASNGDNVTPAVECLLNLVMNRIERNGALLADQLPVRRYGTRNSRPDDPDSFALGDTDAQKESNCSCWPATTSDIQEYSISSQYLTRLFCSVLSSVHSGLLLLRSIPPISPQISWSASRYAIWSLLHIYLYSYVYVPYSLRFPSNGYCSFSYTRSLRCTIILYLFILSYI